MSIVITRQQLEHMKTHELAELLANVVMLLRRMPNVECSQLTQLMPETSNVFEQEEAAHPQQTSSSSFSQQELKKKTVAELKALAKELHIVVSVKTKKDELIEKILARSARGHSEQFAIQHM